MRKRSEARARPQREHNTPDREFEIEVPNDAINEMVVLAAMMVDLPTCDRLIPMIPPDAFYAKEHKMVREAIGEARRQQLALDPATLIRIAPDVDPRVLEKLPAQRPDLPENINFHVDQLLWDWTRAKAAIGPVASFLEALQNHKEDRAKVKNLAQSIGEVFDGEHGEGRFIRNGGELIRETMATLQKRAAGEAYYPYGIPGLDLYEDGTRRLRPGAGPGSITLVTALSGSGKSTIMGHLANAIGRQRRKVLFGAWEEDAKVTIELLATLVLGWSRSRVLDGKSHIRTEGNDDWGPMTHEDFVVFEETMHKISKWVSFFDNPFQYGEKLPSGRTATNDDHINVIEEHLVFSGCDVFFADLLHRSFVDDSPSAERQALNRILKIVQRRHVHLIAAHQQRAKDIEARVDKRPSREGLMGTAAWLDVPWTILAPHIPAKWKNVPDTTLEIYILKQRNGPWPIGIEFDWEPDTGQISGGRSIDVKNAVETSEAFGVDKSPTKSKSKAKRLGFGSKRS